MQTRNKISNFFSEFYPHDIVVHIKTMPYIKIAFTVNVHPHTTIEIQSWIVAVHVQLHSACSGTPLTDIVQDTAKQRTPVVLFLLFLQHVNLFKM